MPWFVTRLIPFADNPIGLQERRLIRNLKVRQRGRIDGRRNHPATHESQVSETEQRIFAAFDNAANELRQAWVNRWRTSSSKIDSHAFNAWEEDYDTPITKGKTNLEEGRQQLRDRMISARRAERAARRDLNLFQQKHALDREANYPDVPLMAVAVLFVLTVAESAVNANLFAQVSDWGLTGGLFYALGMSIPNVIGGALLGFFSLRASVHAHWLAKALGVITTLLGIGALLFYNFYLSHYRALLAINPDAEMGAAWQRLFSDPFSFLASRDAVILLFLGVAAAVVAVWEGMNGFSDRYWGYAGADKKYKDASAAYDAAKAAYRSSANSAIAAAQADIQKRLESVDTKNQAVMTVTRDTVHDHEVIQTAMQASAHACRAALNTYRHENMMVRTTAKPTFFDDYPIFDEKLPPVGDLITRRDQVNDTARELHQAANNALDRLHEHHRAFMSSVESDIVLAEQQADERAQRDRAEIRGTFAYQASAVS
jgi:hypothetical protein